MAWRGLLWGAVLGVALLYAWDLRWLSEDAFISLRYARNLVEGHGLVFNVGERVEGYTNFLWTLLLAGGLALGSKPETLVPALGLPLVAGTFGLLVVLHRRLCGAEALLPAAPAALALHYTWIGFETSGLELPLLGLLLCAAFLASELAAERPTREARLGLAGAGALLGLAMMTRPDAALALPGLLAVLGLRRGRRALGPAAALGAGLLLVYGPYFAWRLGYYGQLFPNTYYAKAAALPHYEQGVVYLWEFARRYSLWLFAPLLLFAGARSAWRPRRVAPLAAGAALYCALHTAYVVRVGGDFMEGRFFVPILPFLYLLLERWARALPGPRLVRGLALALVVLTAALDRPVLEPREIEQGITDERSWAPVFARWREAGAVFGRHLPEDTWVATDAVGAFGWSSRLPIVDTLGLTDAVVAHQPIERRSRPGHEKTARRSYLRERGVALVRDGLGRYAFSRPPDLRYAGNRYFLLSRDPEVVQGFRRAAAELRQRRRDRAAVRR